MPKAGRPFKHRIEMLLLSLSSSNGPVAMALKDISGSALRQKFGGATLEASGLVSGVTTGVT